MSVCNDDRELDRIFENVNYDYELVDLLLGQLCASLQEHTPC